MRLLFFDGASRCRVGATGKIYTGSNLESNIVERYRRYGDELALFLIEEGEVYGEEAYQRQVNEVETLDVEIFPLPNIYRPRINYFNVKLRQKSLRWYRERFRRRTEL